MNTFGESAQDSMVLDLVGDLETYLGAKAERVNVEQVWNDEPPKEASGQTLHTYLADVSLSITGINLH